MMEGRVKLSVTMVGRWQKKIKITVAKTFKNSLKKKNEI